MNQTTLYHRVANLLTRCAAAIGLMLVCTTVVAFDELNEAQTLLFNSPHLMNTQDGQSISYRYRSEIEEEEPIEDVVTLSVTAQVDDERRDVKIDFLTDEKRMILPPFPGYRGNPVLMAMLEHVVRGIGEDTGGGTLYFRNRIRDALASDKVSVEKKKMSVNDNEVDTTVVQFQPFENDQNIASDSIYGDAVFTITLSDTVPGGIVGVGVNASHDGQPAFSQQLTISN